jgi:hypothetical protein
MIETFAGNKAGSTMLPTIKSFMAAHQLVDVTADAGMVSETNRSVIADAKLSYIIGARMPAVPYVISAWRAVP